QRLLHRWGAIAVECERAAIQLGCLFRNRGQAGHLLLGKKAPRQDSKCRRAREHGRKVASIHDRKYRLALGCEQRPPARLITVTCLYKTPLVRSQGGWRYIPVPFIGHLRPGACYEQLASVPECSHLLRENDWLIHHFSEPKLKSLKIRQAPSMRTSFLSYRLVRFLLAILFAACATTYSVLWIIHNKYSKPQPGFTNYQYSAAARSITVGEVIPGSAA